MKNAKLEFSGATLEFRINDNDWCQVELDTGESVFQLGADTWNIVKQRISAALADLSSTSEPEWMISLSEKHCCLYRQNIDGKNYFFWQDDHGNIIWESDLVDPVDEELLHTTLQVE